MNIPEKVDQAIRAEIGDVIDGVSFGKLKDKLTWKVQFLKGATKQDRLAAQDVIDAFDVEAASDEAEPVDDVTALRQALIKKGVITEQDVASEKLAPTKVSTKETSS